MKSVIIVLVCTVICAVAGFFGTAVVVRSSQNNTSLPAETGDVQRDLANAERGSSEALGNLVEAQKDAMIGGWVGVGSGLLLGIAAAKLLGKPKPPAAGA